MKVQVVDPHTERVLSTHNLEDLCVYAHPEDGHLMLRDLSRTKGRDVVAWRSNRGMVWDHTDDPDVWAWHDDLRVVAA